MTGDIDDEQGSTSGPAEVRAHRIRAGDCVESLAFRHGLAPHTLWDHPSNEPLRAAGVDPHVLPPGETIHIPAIRQGSVDKPIDRRHRFRRVGVPSKLELQLVDEDGPRAGLRVELEIDGDVRDVVTDGDGRIDEWISPTARRGRLVVSEYESYELELGHLTPPNERDDGEEGVRSRLRNLGYDPGRNDASLASALAWFQADHDLPETGEADDATCARLIEEHGS